ncbi:hypothetical protein EW026_g5416 [Hermanssonia centrifuga]|uniref:histone acetyltransferase n=1 Tax=Hermanssonia centrifuga TaxID=98765 RepID=A0A4S4KEE6_9APHY|nr:hypothetical protein EW026_g5416 [Hermanssonia centrifuga]
MPGPSGAHTGSLSTARIPGVARASFKSHGRTSDLLAGGLGRTHGAGEKSVLWVCDKCFKYMSEGLSWELHVKKCTRRHPPGKKVYQRGAHIVWEVDGAKEKLYCQNLSLFGKLFIDVKTLFFDCDNFLFYILTDADSQRDHVLGFFSKEKLSYDDYNLACIVVLPPYQKKGYGMLLIEFSYELSRRAGKLGTPERPLSDLGLRSYLTYWIATLVRYFRRLLSVLPPGSGKIITNGNSHTPDTDLSMSPTRESEEANGLPRKRRKSTKGWDGEAIEPMMRNTYIAEDDGARGNTLCLTMGAETNCLGPMYTTFRSIEMKANPDGSATSHVVVRCTLADLARATGLRVEDAAFALNECGMLTRRKQIDLADTKDREKDTAVAVARERGVKKMCMDLAHVLL